MACHCHCASAILSRVCRNEPLSLSRLHLHVLLLLLLLPFVCVCLCVRTQSEEKLWEITFEAIRLGKRQLGAGSWGELSRNPDLAY